jgi:hypothetical protein
LFAVSESEHRARQIIAEYVDTVTGSGKKDRAQFEAMMLVRKTLRYLEQLDAWGVLWRSFMEPFAQGQSS